MFMMLVTISAVTVHVPFSSSSDTLQNEHLRAVITPATMGVRAGSLLELRDLATGVDLAAGRQFGGIQCGPFIPVPGEIIHISDTSAVFFSPMLYDYSGSVSLPISVAITWTLSGRGLEIATEIIATGDAELEHPLEMDYYAGFHDTALFGNQSNPIERTVGIHAIEELYRISGDQVVRLHGADSIPRVTFLFPNPSKGILALNTGSTVDNYLAMRFFDVEPPRENCMGPDLHSVLPEGDTSNYFVRILIGDDAVPVYISAHPDGYEHTASWIMDEIPFIHPDQGDLWGYSTTSSGDERVSAQMIQLLEDHPQMKMNWLILPDGILTPNRDSVWFEPGYEDSWSHWHCTWRISTVAPEDFLDWLRNIQDDVYPWADRVELGSHGYHHTPNQDSSFGEFHEFITYEPEEHMERFKVIMEDYLVMGLDTSLVRTIRYPGHRTSLSGLWATIEYGFDFYCNGIRWWEWVGGEPFLDLYISKYQTPAGRIWGTNTVWWGDYWSQQPDEYLSEVMERGKHCLIGAHPINMLSPDAWPEPYDRIDSLCTSMETDYPNFGWLFPMEYGDLLEECCNSTVTSIRYSDNGLDFSFTGATSQGQTLVVEMPDEAQVQDILVNGSSTTWEERSGGRLFISIDSLGQYDHTVEISWYETGIGEGSGPSPGTTELWAVNPSISLIALSGLGFPEGACDVSLFDTAGRLVLRAEALPDAEGRFFVSLPWRGNDGRELPAGVYCILVTSGGSVASLPVIHLPD